MLNYKINNTLFAKEVLTQFDMKDSRLTFEVMRQALVRYVEVAENLCEEDEIINCPHCGENI